jgi:N-methylhydantoinase B
VRRDVRVLSGEVAVSAMGDRHRTPPPGLCGGASGRCGSFQVVGHNGERQTFRGRMSDVRLVAGDVISVLTSGGGGYGRPSEREEERVEADVERGTSTE